MQDGRRARDESGDRFTIVHVCHANLCRSVTAAFLMDRALEAQGVGGAWDVRSAGLDVRPGAVLPSPVADVMAGIGIPLDRRPQQLDLALVRDADLILTAERGQRARIARRDTAAARKTFTIRQFGRLCAAGREATGRGFTTVGDDLLELAGIGREFVQPVGRADDEVADPVMIGTSAAMLSCLATIDQSIRQITGS